MKNKDIIIIVMLLFAVFPILVYAQSSSRGVITVGNVAPSVTAVSVTSDATGVTSSPSKPTNETDYVNFTVTWTDSNSNPVSVFVCKTSSATAGGCSGASWATSASSSVNPRTLTYTTLVSDPEINQAFVFASDGAAVSSEAAGNQSFFVNHKPFASSVTTNPGSPTESSTLTCTYTFNDPDSGDTERVANTVFQWYIKDEGAGTFTVIAGQTSGSLANTNFDKNDVLNCRVRVTDSHGLSDDIHVNSTNFVTIGNSAPNSPTSLLVQDGSAPDYDNGLSAHDGTAGYDTHMRTPRVRWTKGTDLDAEDSISTYVCIATVLNGCNLAGVKTNFAEYNITAGLLDYIGASRQYFVKLVANDGVVNSTNFNQFFNLTNDIPTAPSLLNPKTTHDPTPLIDYANSIDADTAGTIDNFPADTLTYFYTSGTSGAGSSELVNNVSSLSSQFQYSSAIPWGSVEVNGWNNRTVNVRVYAADSHNGGTSSFYDDTFVLYDFLPDIVQLQITDSGRPYTDMAVNPVSHANAFIALRLTATDKDGDCAFGHRAYISLCDNSTVATCTESNAQYRFLLPRSTVATGDDCYYDIPGNTSTGTPEFWKTPGTWKLRGNITENLSAGSGNQRASDPQKNTNFLYNELNAVNYLATLYLGDSVIDLGQFNTNTTPAILENWGNIALNLSWRVTDPISDDDYWNLSVEGNDDFLIDDDSDVVAEPTPGVIAVNLIYTNRFFHPNTGLQPCSSDFCNSALLNETFSTFYHIRPPIGLLPGVYNNTITLTRVKK